MGEPVLCPDCGWTGQESDIESENGDYQCPVCMAVINS